MSDTTNNPLSSNPAQVGHLAGVLDFVMQKFLAGQIDDMLPATVVSYKRSTNRAQVQPMINMVTSKGNILRRPQLASVPVFQAGGGGAVLSFNLLKGDTGWIKSNDRDISLYLQSYQQSIPNTKRKHDFNDALFIPDTLLRNVAIASEDEANALLQNITGNVRIALWPSQLKVTAPNSCITNQSGYTANANAVLDVQSTTGAFKIPRMTHAQRNSIPSPVGGMMVYVTDAPTGVSSYIDGVGWS